MKPGYCFDPTIRSLKRGVKKSLRLTNEKQRIIINTQVAKDIATERSSAGNFARKAAGQLADKHHSQRPRIPFTCDSCCSQWRHWRKEDSLALEFEPTNFVSSMAGLHLQLWLDKIQGTRTSNGVIYWPYCTQPKVVSWTLQEMNCFWTNHSHYQLKSR